jgi:hypothetical protein
MPFTDFLKATVITSAAAATLLAAITVAASGSYGDPLLIPFATGWWLVAAVIGAVLGRRAQTSPPIARLLAAARSTKALPEVQFRRILLNRLWPLLLCTVLAGGLALVLPQIAAITTGFAIIWALSWRRQDAAVTAIEERDGVRYYVDRTSPTQAMRLLRTPGFKSRAWDLQDAEVTPARSGGSA